MGGRVEGEVVGGRVEGEVVGGRVEGEVVGGRVEGEVVREQGGGGSGGKRRRGDRKEWEEGKGEGSPDQAFKYLHLPLEISSSFPLLPSSLPSKLSYFLDKLNLIVTTSCIESQTQTHNNYSYNAELEKGRADCPTWVTVTHTGSCVLFLTFLTMQVIPLPLANLSQIMIILIQQVCS